MAVPQGELRGHFLPGPSSIDFLICPNSRKKVGNLWQDLILCYFIPLLFITLSYFLLYTVRSNVMCEESDFILSVRGFVCYEKLIIHSSLENISLK